MGSKLHSFLSIFTTKNQFLLIAGVVIISSISFYFGTGFQPIWWLTWLAPLPILLIAPRLGFWTTFAIAALCWFIGGINMWSFYRSFVQIPIPLMLLFSAFPALIFSLDVVLFRHFLNNGSVEKAAFAFPTLWVSYEFLTSLIWSQDTYGNLGYTQMNNLVLLQIVSVVGIWGISFSLFLLPATIAALINSAGTPVKWQRLAISVAVIVIAIVGQGIWRLTASPAMPTIKVGLAAIGIKNSYSLDRIKGKPAPPALLRDYLEQVKRLAGQGAKVVLLPEKIGNVSEQNIDKFDKIFKSTADTAGIDIVVGIDHLNETIRSNEARLYTVNGTTSEIYKKQHLAPRYEDGYQAGTSLLVANRPAGVYGIEICKDMDFPALSRQYSNAGTAVMFVPAWDSIIDGWLHARMAIMRGVESGFTIVRAANHGRLTVSDNRGRVIAEQNSEFEPYNSLIADVPIEHTDTIYARLGDWFGWLNVVILIGILINSRKIFL